jgi:SulP family sulfate permease
LSALIIFAMAGMLDVGYFQRLWSISRIEFLLAVLAFLGVLTFGVLPGVAIGVLFALLILVEHIGRPVGMIAGRTPEGEWRDVAVVPDAETVDGLVIYRQETPIVFLNARRTTDQLRELATDGIRVIAIDAAAVSSIDSTGFSALRTVRGELASKGTEIWVINPSIRKRALVDEQADVLDATLPRRFETYDDALDAYRQLDAPGPGEPKRMQP